MADPIISFTGVQKAFGDKVVYDDLSLDVYEGEPNLDPGYLGLANTFLLPHLGSATIETRNAMGFKALDNLDNFFRDEAPPDRVA